MRHQSRRNFLKTAGFTIAAMPLVLSHDTAADDVEPVRLDEADPAAKALGYRHNVADVDVGQFPRSAPVDGVRPNCANCLLYQAKEGEQWGGCAIFPARQVNAAGWCKAWAPKAD